MGTTRAPSSAVDVDHPPASSDDSAKERARIELVSFVEGSDRSKRLPLYPSG